MCYYSGGCKISIKGNNLNSVSKPKLIVYKNETRIQKEVKQLNVKKDIFTYNS